MECLTDRQRSRLPLAQPDQGESASPTSPERIWEQLTTQQRQGVFQRLVQMCQELLQNRQGSRPKEVKRDIS